MRFGRVGGWLILGGGAVVAIAIWRYLDGDGVGFGSANASGFLIDIAVALFGVGAVVLCAVGPEPLNGRLIRAGLGILAIGQLTLLAVAILITTSPPELLPGQPFLLLDGGGALAAGLGLLLLGLALLRRPGRARAVGALFLVGIGLGAASTIAYDYFRIEVPMHTGLLALVLVILGNVGVGLLAIKGEPATALGSSAEARLG